MALPHCADNIEAETIACYRAFLTGHSISLHQLKACDPYECIYSQGDILRLTNQINQQARMRNPSLVKYIEDTQAFRAAAPEILMQKAGFSLALSTHRASICVEQSSGHTQLAHQIFAKFPSYRASLAAYAQVSDNFRKAVAVHYRPTAVL